LGDKDLEKWKTVWFGGLQRGGILPTYMEKRREAEGNKKFGRVPEAVGAPTTANP